MHLYLSNSPRVLYLVTGSHDHKLGRPPRALVFRAALENSAQVVVEFLHKDDVDLSNLTRLTSRVVKGCLGLISIDNGAYLEPRSIFFAVYHSLHKISSWQSSPLPQK